MSCRMGGGKTPVLEASEGGIGLVCARSSNENDRAWTNRVGGGNVPLLRPG